VFSSHEESTIVLRALLIKLNNIFTTFGHSLIGEVRVFFRNGGEMRVFPSNRVRTDYSYKRTELGENIMRVDDVSPSLFALFKCVVEVASSIRVDCVR
jgi:hypothetical protein